MRISILIFATLLFLSLPAKAQQSSPDLQYSNHRWRPGYDTRKIGNKL